MSGPTDPAEEHFDKGSWGYDGSQWRKMPLVWGYYDTYVEAGSVRSAGAGVETVVLGAVPAGYVYVVNTIAVLDITTDPTKVEGVVVKGGIDVPVFTKLSPGVNAWYAFVLSAALKEGDYVKAWFTGTANGDWLLLRAEGYKMRINL